MLAALSHLVSHVLRHSSQEAFLFSFARLWPACCPPDSPSFEDRCNICLLSSHQECLDGLQLPQAFRDERAASW